MLLDENSPIIGTSGTISGSPNPDTGGWVEINRLFASGFAALGLDSASSFLDLPGEIVSGHPDRHVVRVELPGFPAAFYLKRQHAVTRREKLRNWRAGFGWISRCEREASILMQLAAINLPCPRWAAVGVESNGRSFLLVEELAGAVDLRQLLSDASLSSVGRASFAKHLGRLIGLYHDMGFTTPELAVKHVLIAQRPGSHSIPQERRIEGSSRTDREIHVPTKYSRSNPFAIALIDWQTSRRVPLVTPRDRVRSLAALHASLAEPLASPRERLRVLWKATRSARQTGLLASSFAEIARLVIAEASHIAERRSIRDQRKPANHVTQRLVWVAGEAVCAVPDVAAIWPKPAIASPFYGGEPGSFIVQLLNGSKAVLVRGRSFAPFGRFKAWLRGRSWRSPGVTLGRLMFQLERYGIPAPRLLAFGQRVTGWTTAEWFALHTPVADPIGNSPDASTAEAIGRMLRQLHDAGCTVAENPLTVFGLNGNGICIRGLIPIRIAQPDVESELGRLLSVLSPSAREAAKVGYRSGAISARGIASVPERSPANRLATADGIP